MYVPIPEDSHDIVDPKEIRQWYKGFLKDCPSGKLDKTRFRNIYQQFFPQSNLDEYTEYLFKAFDSDKNGYIDFKEFMCGLSVTSRGSLDEKLECNSPITHGLHSTILELGLLWGV